MSARGIKPIWKTSSLLIYTGGLTVLLGGVFAVTYLSIEYSGGGARTAWALLILVVLWVVAGGLGRGGPRGAAGAPQRPRVHPPPDGVEARPGPPGLPSGGLLRQD